MAGSFFKRWFGAGTCSAADAPALHRWAEAQGHRFATTQLQQQVFEQCTEGNQTRIDDRAPQQMRWLVLYEKIAAAARCAAREVARGALPSDHPGRWGTPGPMPHDERGP